MKNLKVYTKLIISYLAIDIIILAFVAMFVGVVAETNVLFGQTEEGRQMLMSVFGKFQIGIVILFIISFLIMTVVTLYFSKLLRVEMGQLNKAADKMANGEVDIELEAHSKDEFGQLVEKMIAVTDVNKEQAALLGEVADGNLLVDVTPRSEQDVMGNAIKKMVTRNKHALSNISDAADMVLVGSSEVSGASEALASGSTEQASAIEQITVSINEVTQKTKQNAAEAENAAEIMNTTLNHVQNGNEQMKVMMQAMNEINSASESISKIIKVIDDIAFQTNILALNAAVEAARAGDAGKGFAVVAEEVRNLAAKSAEAASETADLIEASIKTVASGTAIASSTANSLDAVTKEIIQGAEIVKNISESSNYQAIAMGQLDSAVAQVSQVVQTNSATSEQCAAAAVELANQAKRMKELLSVYKLDDGQNANENENDYGYASSKNDNEKIISLTDGFGKY